MQLALHGSKHQGERSHRHSTCTCRINRNGSAAGARAAVGTSTVPPGTLSHGSVRRSPTSFSSVGLVIRRNTLLVCGPKTQINNVG